MGDILAIVGSTHFDRDMQAWWNAHNFIHTYMQGNMPDKVISGGAVGIDTIAVQVANIYGVHFQNFYPENNRWEPDGYRKRNIEIAKACTRLLCIRHFQSSTRGSSWTADHAQSLGKEVDRYEYNSIYEIKKL